MKEPLRRKIISLALFFSTKDKKIQKDKMQWPKEKKKAKRVDTTYKTKDRTTRTPIIPWMISCVPEG